jgi:sortilin
MNTRSNDPPPATHPPNRQGVYVANQVDPAAGGAARGREAALLRTRLSLTGGASWRLLAPPAAFRFPRCNACAPGAAPGSDACALHLHGPTSWFAPEGPHPNLYTLEAAPGLALATGNVGAHLDFSPDADCTFLSRDGGATWEDVADNTAIYEIGAAGSIIVMAAHRSEGPADAVRLSLDTGACWHTVRLPEPMLVDNIRVDPSGGGRVFLVHGQACARSEARPACTYMGGGGGPPGKLFSVDVRELLGADFRECDAADGSADYEAWAPPAPGGCLLGAARAARRRARDAFCVSPPSFSAALAPPGAPCACAADADLECEFGFARPPGAGANATCAPMPGVAPADACPRLLSSGYRASSTHTRLVHGDACAGVGALIPDTDGQGGKPGSSGGGGSGGGGAGGKGGGAASAARRFFVFLLLAGAGGAAAALAWAHCLAPAQREAAMSAAMPVLAALAAGAEAAFGFVVDAWDWARARLRERGILRGGDAAYGYGFGGGAPGGAYEPLAGGGGLDLAAEDAASPAPFARGGEP